MSVLDPQPAPPRRPWWILIVVGAIVVIGVLVWGVVAVFSAALGHLRTSEGDPQSQPLVAGTRQSATATVPLDCPKQCFAPDGVESLLLRQDALATLGSAPLAATQPYGSLPSATAGQMAQQLEADWGRANGSPDVCFFAPTNSPVGPARDFDAPDNPDVVDFVGTYEDVERTQLVDQSVRYFPNSDAASAYLSTLATQIDACDALAVGPPTNRQSATVTAAPQLDVPSSVASIGWVRTGYVGPRWRAYIFDLQRGNVVVRIRAITDGQITEQEFRSFVVGYADILDGAPARVPKS